MQVSLMMPCVQLGALHSVQHWHTMCSWVCYSTDAHGVQLARAQRLRKFVKKGGKEGLARSDRYQPMRSCLQTAVLMMA
eukprot:3939475-Rhodomonas_salina.3